jgi:hypothetical protein
LESRQRAECLGPSSRLITSSNLVVRGHNAHRVFQHRLARCGFLAHDGRPARSAKPGHGGQVGQPDAELHPE